MKKLSFIMMIMIFMVLSACTTQVPPEPTPSEPTPTPVEPTPTESVIDPIEQIFMDSTTLTNYTLTVLIFHQSDIFELTIKVTDTLASIDMEGVLEYFTKGVASCLHYIPTHDGYITQSIDCDDEQTSTYGFFEAFQLSWFSLLDDKYYLNLEHYQALSNFFGQTMEGAVVSNFELTLGTTHFNQFKFDIHVGELLYRLDMTFSDIGQTEVVLPMEG